MEIPVERGNHAKLPIRFYVDSATTGNRDPCRDRQPGLRHGRAGSDAAISAHASWYEAPNGW
jgi:hypothetical protein